MNYRFSINEWLARFPLEPEYGHYHGEIIVGPREICNNEQLRREMQDQFAWGTAAPVDIFIMADGEPPNRFATKIGGLPYRPSDLDWPTTLSGAPLFFVAQLNFSDSHDLVGTLPGEVLLVFADNAEGPLNPLHFEWQELNLTNLVRREDIPYHPFSFAPCYGHVFRTVSYPVAERPYSTDSAKYPKCRGIDVWSSFHLLQYHATQIGGAPFFIQPGDDQLPGYLLCTISSVNPQRHRSYPFINRNEPLMPEEKWMRSEYLMMGDVGCIYISADETGALHYRESCY
jgi:hypothetical protein